MSCTRFNRIECLFEDAGSTVMDRVRGNNAALITQATITSIALKVLESTSEADVFNAIGEEVSGTGGALTVASHVYDTLQTDANWTKDVTGYNFRYAAPAACFPTGNRWYSLWFLFTPTSGEPFWVVWYGLAQAVPEMS